MTKLWNWPCFVFSMGLSSLHAVVLNNISIDNLDDVTWLVIIFSYHIPEGHFYLKNVYMTCLPLQRLLMVTNYRPYRWLMHWRYCSLALNHLYIFAPTHFHGSWSNHRFNFTFVTAAGRLHVLMSVIQCSHGMINLLEDAIILWRIETRLSILGVFPEALLFG